MFKEYLIYIFLFTRNGNLWWLMPIVFIYIIIIPYIHEFVKMDAWPLDTTADDVRQRYSCPKCKAKGNNTYQIVLKG